MYREHLYVNKPKLTDQHDLSVKIKLKDMNENHRIEIAIRLENSMKLFRENDHTDILTFATI